MFLSLASWRRWLWLAIVVVFASACQADFDVVVTMNEDGSGTVSTTTSIDADASEELLDLDLDGLVLADLAQAGWVIGRPERDATGSTVITASKDFGTVDQFAEVMAELVGERGPFRDFRVTRTKSFARVDYGFEGVIDTTVDLEAFSDPELEEMLGRSLNDIAGRYGATENQIDLRLEVTLPGDLQGDEPTGVVDSEPGLLRAEWRASLADDERVAVALDTATRDVAALVLRGVAIVAAVLAGLVVFAQILRILLPDRRRRPGRKPPAQKSQAQKTPVPAVADGGTGGETEPSVEAETEKSLAASPYRVVALDAMGVLYREANDVSALLIPFIRARENLGLSDDEIAARARSLSLGRITTGQFWEAVGVRGETAELDRAYLSQHQLTTGVIRYLRGLRDNGVQVACVTNDAAAWATSLRSSHNLESLIDPWIVSGSVGVRKPDKSIFEVLRRLTGHPPSEILVIDDDLDILDAAREQGFATAWFAPGGQAADARDHQLIRSFENVDAELVDSEAAGRPD